MSKGKKGKAGGQKGASTSGLQLANPFESLNQDEDSLPPIPDIPDVDDLNETQRKMMLLKMAKKLHLSPDSLPGDTATSNSSAQTSDDAVMADDGPEASAAPPNGANGNFVRSCLTPSRKRGHTAATAAVDSKRPRISTSGGEVEKVFLSGVKKDFVKNGIIFKREFSKAMPNINLDKVIITQTGILSQPCHH